MIERGARGVFLAALLAFSLVPFYWMVVASLKPSDAQLTSGNPWWFDGFVGTGYGGLLADNVFRDWMVNTITVLLAAVLISVIASALAAYALAYLDVPYGRSLLLAFFGTYLVPQGVLFLALVREMARLHLLNSPVALVATFPSLVIPFGTWVLWSFFRSLPRDLVDLARLEGAGPLALLTRILFPMAGPALAAVGLFAVAIVFNDFLYSFTLIQSQQQTTLMAGVGLLSTDLGETGPTFAAVLVGVAPIALVCAFFTDSYAMGLGAGVIE